MAQADIYLDLEQLKNDVITLNDKKLQEIDRAMRSACNTVRTLTSSGWSGEAKEAFMEKFTAYTQDMKVCYDELKVFNQQLKTIHSNGKKLLTQGDKVIAKI